MNALIEFIKSFWTFYERGEMDNYPEPAPPGDLGAALSQDEIDFIKKLKKEMEERFLAPP